MTSNKQLPPQWCNQIYTVGGTQFAKGPGFTVELIGANNLIDAQIKPIKKDRMQLMHDWLDKYAATRLTVFCEAGDNSGYITFYISSNLSVICGEGEYGPHLDRKKLKSQSSFVFQYLR